MNCPRISRSGKPAGWLHALCCAECRGSKRADDLLAFGIVQLRKQANAHAALNRTLAALALPSVTEDYGRLLKRRAKNRARMAAGAGLCLCLAGWLGYMDWMPPTAALAFPEETSPAYQALMHVAPGNANAARQQAQLNGVSASVRRLIEHPETASVADVTTAAQYVSENRHCLDVIHANLLKPFKGSIDRLAPGINENYHSINSLITTLQAEAACKAAHGDRSGTIEAALDLIAFGENVAGGGSWPARSHGDRCQAQGRLLLWRFLPDLSASEAHHVLLRLSEAGRHHSPLLDTVQWEQAATVFETRRLLRTPLWRLRTVDQFTRPIMYPGEVESRLNVTLRLYARSNQRILQELEEAQMASKQQFNDRYTPNRMALTEQEDPLDQQLRPDYTSFYRQKRVMELVNETQSALLKTAVAIRAYHVEHGVDPPNLNALCPQYLDAVPADPFRPQAPLQYAPLDLKFHSFTVDATGTADATGLRGAPGIPMASITAPRNPAVSVGPGDHLGGSIATLPYLLYSVGPDCVDQHGAFIKQEPSARVNSSIRDKFRVQEESQGDIVAGINL